MCEAIQHLRGVQIAARASQKKQIAARVQRSGYSSK